MARAKSSSSTSTATIGFEAKLWLTADKLRNNMDAAEYKHVVLGLIFLKYISDSSKLSAPSYADVAGFYKSATTAEIAAHGHVLTPGRYVGAEEVEDDGDPFEEKMPRLVAELAAQFAESAKLEQAIKANLKGLGYGG